MHMEAGQTETGHTSRKGPNAGGDWAGRKRGPAGMGRTPRCSPLTDARQNPYGIETREGPRIYSDPGADGPVLFAPLVGRSIHGIALAGLAE